MELGKDSVMVIHGGGFYGDKEGTIKRWCENYFNLDEKIRNRLVLKIVKDVILLKIVLKFINM